MKTTVTPTFRKKALMVGAAASAMLMAACGGNNTPDPTPTPTPTGTATPTPTPTATDAADINFANDFAYGSSRIYIYAYFTPTGGVEMFSDATRLNENGGVAYSASPETVLFGFPDLDDPVAFDATTLVNGTDTLRTYEMGDEKLILELPFGNVLRGTYERTDSDIVSTEPGDLRSRRVVILIDGVTTTDDITSNISYTGTPHVVGGTPGTTLPDAITAPSRTFSIDASDTTVSGTIQIFEDVGGTPTLVAELVLDTEITANGTFSDDLTDSVGDLTGALTGTLAGANREEITFIFSASNAAGRKFVGSYIGVQPTT